MSEIYVTDLPLNQVNAFLHQMVSEDPAFVYYGQTIPPGHDPEADRLRAIGQIQIFKCERPIKTQVVDRDLHRLMRRK